MEKIKVKRSILFQISYFRKSVVKKLRVFTSVVHLVLIYLRSSSKRETDVLEIMTFCLHLIGPSVQDLYLNKVILRGVITSSISTR